MHGQSLVKKQFKSTSIFKPAGCKESKLYSQLVSFWDTVFLRWVPLQCFLT